MTADQNKKSISAGPSTDTAEVRIKVEEDIAFLKARIALLENHPRPNRIVLGTYQTMLSSRLAVLRWLQHGSPDSENIIGASGGGIVKENQLRA